MAKKQKKSENATSSKLPRPPIVVVLGHVDHGKTTLLDYIRQTKVASLEPGQITQSIGAYQADFGKEKITFIDTPGHEAFSKMRSRGAQVADIAILVVAADDGVMPQTKEAIKFIDQAKIPIIVAINKIDLAGANQDKVKKQLAKEGILLEGYGGQVVAVALSAKTGAHVNDLLEMIILLSQMQNLKANPEGVLEAVVIESKLDRNRGPVASVLIKNGTLKQGEEIFADRVKGKVKSMINDRGEILARALPATPVEILGFDSLPAVGAIVHRGLAQEEVKEMAPPVAKPAEEAQLKVILKTDVMGMIEVICASLAKEDLLILKAETGDISQGDVLLAKATEAIIIGFRVKVSTAVATLAEEEKVKIKTYEVIYKLIEEIKEVVKALKEPVQELALGKAEIIAEFPYQKGKIAGCRVVSGRVALGDKVKIIRGEKEVGLTKIKSLRKQKEAISKAELGEEFGLLLEPIIDFQIGDIVQSYRS
jgi:translation initiation factor IF-2